jgi:hypothetical protein
VGVILERVRIKEMVAAEFGDLLKYSIDW